MKTKTMAVNFTALGVAINLVLAFFVQTFKIPLLFLDTIGTVLVAVLFGPWWGAAAGMLTNLLQGLSNPKGVPFVIVSVVVGLLVGFIARKFDFRKWYVAVGTGILLSIVAPLIGTPIAVAVYGGLTGSGTDLLVLWLRATGEGIFASTFLSRIAGNIVDKIGTCLFVLFLLWRVPLFQQFMLKGDKIIAQKP
ncbi:CD3073 family putative ECF transporter S component [Brevibacillus sp. B_LB10_24]|uniref:CD3073 family putative ECF transporter S component n=1 Tax=Brevibacillus sp. B_LB10_24 TaxID=3380645 RepID=UPI0038BBBFF3